MLVEAGANFSYELQLAAIVGAEKKRAEMIAGAGRSGEAADYEFVFLMDFYFEPVSGATFDVGGFEIFGDEAFEIALDGELIGCEAIGCQAL